MRRIIVDSNTSDSLTLLVDFPESSRLYWQFSRAQNFAPHQKRSTNKIELAMKLGAKNQLLPQIELHTLIISYFHPILTGISVLLKFWTLRFSIIH